MKRLTFILVIALIFAINSNIQSKTPVTNSQTAMTCTDCHPCELLTKDNPCMEECPQENKSSERRFPEERPGLIKMNKLNGETGLYNGVFFPHRLHSEMSETSNGCGTCHHYNHPDKIIGCETCHNKDRKREDLGRPDLKGANHRMCMDCHRELTGKVECVSCHQLKSSQPVETAEEKTHLKVKKPVKIKYETPGAEGGMVSFYHNEHIELFGIECKTCHSNDGCIKCHDKRSEGKKVKAEKEDFHQSCSNCHDTDDNCLSCHSDEEKEGFNHLKRTGFNTAKIHSKLECVNCHTEPGLFTGLDRNCEGCHKDWPPENFNHEVTGLILDEIHTDLNCEICHTDGDYSRPNCADCHGDAVKYPDIIPGELME